MKDTTASIGIAMICGLAFGAATGALIQSRMNKPCPAATILHENKAIAVDFSKRFELPVRSTFNQLKELPLGTAFIITDIICDVPAIGERNEPQPICRMKIIQSDLKPSLE